jgi:FkbM family methyltransferase
MIRRHVSEMLALDALGTRGRLELAFLYATRFWRHGTARITIGGSPFRLDRRTLDSDWQTLRGIVVPRARDYPIEFEDAVVIDIGAHKGYFGLYAVLSGARRVVSYEPAAANFRFLERAARGRPQWEVHRAAVGPTGGEGVLTLSRESWSHSLQEVEDQIGTEPVAVVAIADVLEPGAIVKIDIEGGERAVIEAADWSRARAVYVEIHDPADADPISKALRAAGLSALDLPTAEVLGFGR